MKLVSGIEILTFRVRQIRAGVPARPLTKGIGRLQLFGGVPDENRLALMMGEEFGQFWNEHQGGWKRKTQIATKHAGIGDDVRLRRDAAPELRRQLGVRSDQRLFAVHL